MTNDFKPISSNTLPKINNLSVIPINKKNYQISSIIFPPINKSLDKNEYFKKKDELYIKSNDIKNLSLNTIYDARKIFEQIIDSSLTTDDKLKHIKCAYEDYINLLENENLHIPHYNEPIDVKNLSTHINLDLTGFSNCLGGQISFNEDSKFAYFYDEHYIPDKNVSKQMNEFFKKNQQQNLIIENSKLKGINLLAENKRLRSELKAGLQSLHTEKLSNHKKIDNNGYKNQTELTIEMVYKLKQHIQLKLQQIEDTKRDIKENYVSKIYIKHLKDNLTEIMTDCEEDQSTIFLLEESIRGQTNELSDIFRVIDVTDEEEKSIWDLINKLKDKEIQELQAKTNILNNHIVSELESDDDSYKWNWYIS